MNLNFSTVNDQTGFANGEMFQSASQVRQYFSVDEQRVIFGDQAIADEALLDRMAQTVIVGRWHCAASFAEHD